MSGNKILSRKQRINRFIDDRDGTFRVYTVVDSPKDPGGWYAWSRHVVGQDKRPLDHFAFVQKRNANLRAFALTKSGGELPK
jgi:hypothetical protein